MARTKRAAVRTDMTAEQAAAAAERAARKRAGIIKAAHILSSQEVAALPPVKQLARAPSELDIPVACDM